MTDPLLGDSSGGVTPPEKVTLWICDRGHVTTTTLDGACWNCNPGGRVPGTMVKAEGTQKPFVYSLEGPGITSRKATDA